MASIQTQFSKIVKTYRLDCCQALVASLCQSYHCYTYAVRRAGLCNSLEALSNCFDRTLSRHAQQTVKERWTISSPVSSLTGSIVHRSNGSPIGETLSANSALYRRVRIGSRIRHQRIDVPLAHSN